MTQLLWILAGGLLGFAVTAVAAGWAKLSRSWLIVPYLGLVGIFLVIYFGAADINVGQEVSQGWGWGLLGGIVVGAALVKNVMAQPSSETPGGATLAYQVTWWGVVYGALDGVFLTVMPVLAVWRAFEHVTWASTWYGVVIVHLLGILASAYITTAYHLGYPEFHNRRVLLPVAGNALMAVAYVVTGNPLSAILSHAVMHVAAVLHGTEATVQLPPHYGNEQLQTA